MVKWRVKVGSVSTLYFINSNYEEKMPGEKLIQRENIYTIKEKYCIYFSLFIVHCIYLIVYI